MGLIKTARLMSQIWDSVKFMQIGRDQIKKQPMLDRNLTTDRRPLQINDGQETSISDFQHFRIFWCMIRCWFSLHAQIREQRLDCYRLLEEVYQKMLKHESLFFAKYLMLFTVLSSADTLCQFTVLIINQMIFDSTLDFSFRLFPHQVAQIGFLALFNNFVCVCEAVCCDKTAIYSALVFLSWLLEEKTKCEGLFTDCGMSPVCCIVSSTVYQEMSNASL